MRIESVEGPIGVDLLKHICDLYGRGVDSRYSDLEFTRMVFNENPAGRSYHVFAYNGEEVVGCYAVIPMRVVARGHSLWAGKAEGLYVRERYRPIGVCLIQEGTSFAARCGIDLQFGLTNNRLNELLHELGLNTLPAVLDHRFCLLRPGDVRLLRANRVRLMAAEGLGTAQAMLRFASAALRSFVSIKINVANHLNAVFAAISDSAECRPDRWSVSMDVDSLRWWNRMGYLDVLTLDGNGEQFVAVTRGAPRTNVEIVRWKVHRLHFAQALYVLKFIIDKANQEGASTVSFSPQADLSNNLQPASFFFGFMRHRTERTLCVRAADSFYLDPRHLGFSWHFSI